MSEYLRVSRAGRGGVGWGSRQETGSLVPSLFSKSHPLVLPTLAQGHPLLPGPLRRKPGFFTKAAGHTPASDASPALWWWWGWGSPKIPSTLRYTEDTSRNLANGWTWRPLPPSVTAGVSSAPADCSPPPRVVTRTQSKEKIRIQKRMLLSSSPGLGHGRGDSPLSLITGPTSCPRVLTTHCSDTASTSLVLGDPGMTKTAARALPCLRQ